MLSNRLRACTRNAMSLTACVLTEAALLHTLDRNAPQLHAISRSCTQSIHFPSCLLLSSFSHSSFAACSLNTPKFTQSMSDTALRRKTGIDRRFDSFHWLFRSNIPRRRRSLLPVDVHKRNFFGMGEILGVLTNPAEAVRSLTESRRLLDEARREISENRERAQLCPKHTFARFPGFFPRPAEAQVLERVLAGGPSFTVLFGASSVGKTALLREVLSNDLYHVLHFDLRIAGFSDLPSLYFSLAQQMEQYFEEIATQLPGYEEFRKEAWAFKHDRLNVERRIANMSKSLEKVKTSDLSRLMELFQSSLLKYWEFHPRDVETPKNGPRRQGPESPYSDRTTFDPGPPAKRRIRWWGGKRQNNDKGKDPEVTSQGEGENQGKKDEVMKKIPVLLFDEAHKLPLLIQSMDAMRCLLDSMLVLTKQDRLCHVIHATNDPFYQTWLRQLNVMQHCKIITVGDCSKAETRIFFQERILPSVPERLRARLDFETLYEAFGGKLVHWHDYATDFVNANGQFEIKQSPHFLQAYALLNLHIIHSSQSPATIPGQEQPNTRRPASGNLEDPVHPNLGPAGFRLYSPTAQAAGAASPFSAMSGASDDRATAMVAGYYAASFTAMQLLKVMSRLTQNNGFYLPYFLLCRELGVRAVDGMVKGRVLELRWTETVTKESAAADAPRASTTHLGPHVGGAIEASTAEDGDIMPVSPGGAAQILQEEMVPEYSESEVVGPKLLAISPILRYAMREVVREYEDEQSTSEYASLTDVDEY